MAKRLCILFFMALAAFSMLSCRLSTLATNPIYADAAVNQSAYYLDFEDGRGNFYDCRFRRLTGTTYSSYTVVAPSTESYRMLFDAVPETERAFLYENIQKSIPFLMKIPADTTKDYPVFLRANRYMTVPFAPQLIGYCDGEGNAKAGLESACDAILRGGSTKQRLYCAVDARGNLIGSEKPRLVTEQGTGNGVMLTLDASLQRLCEAAAHDTMDKGAVVVMDTATGRVRASVSLPDYDPSHVAQSLWTQDAPFVNRCISSYNVGSVFKPLIAAVALESGFDIDALYECDGSITVADHTYRCAYGHGHGAVNLEQALAQSCNCYFVQMALALGGELLVQEMQQVGFGESTVIAGNLRTVRGSIPTVEELKNLGALASVSFGQGTLTASPIQIAGFFNTIANDGVYLSPTFVEGYVDEYSKTIAQSLYAPVVRRCMQPETAATLRRMLTNVVENGLGQGAKPKHGSAGGKTGTAQTGRYTESGEEIMDAWFAGFYPAEQPEYTIVVLLDSGTNDSDDACAVFARVADALAYFTQANLTSVLPHDIAEKQTLETEAPHT
ncbi:MAG: penicillin-binding protein 2 [Ruthenibacterium sp.]